MGRVSSARAGGGQQLRRSRRRLGAGLPDRRGQAEYVRVPYADNGLTRIPDGVTDRQALFTGDILSTGFWAAQLGEIREGDTVAVLGAAPQGSAP